MWRAWESPAARSLDIRRAAFEEHDGREVHTEGDWFFVAFVRASDAVAAAVSAQRALAAQCWPEGLEVRVRIGVHTGTRSRRLALALQPAQGPRRRQA